MTTEEWDELELELRSRLISDLRWPEFKAIVKPTTATVTVGVNKIEEGEPYIDGLEVRPFKGSVIYPLAEIIEFAHDYDFDVYVEAIKDEEDVLTPVVRLYKDKPHEPLLAD